MLELVRRASRKHPGLAPALTGLADLHQAHDDLIADSASASGSSTPTPVRIPARSGKALDLVRTRELSLQDEFADLARRARSGPLARLLASMSAAIAQHGRPAAGRDEGGPDEHPGNPADNACRRACRSVGVRALGAQTSQSGEPALYALITTSYTTHRSRRDQLIRAVRDLGVEPVASDVAYELPNDLSTPAKVAAAALQIETDALPCTRIWWPTPTATSASGRSWP